MEQGYLHIRIVADTDATVAVAEMYGMVLTASAKREPGDRPDRGIGEDLALARVLAKAARRLERRARGRVKHAADVKTARAGRAAALEQGARGLAVDHESGMRPRRSGRATPAGRQ